MFQIRKAERRHAKLRLALMGVSGSGKSLGAINLALGMGKKFCVIDTEESSADLYASVADFDVLILEKPFTPQRYISAIETCEKAGYEIIIIDSLSHAWSGEGGVLEMQDAATNASKSKNSYMAWREVTPWHNKLVNSILHSQSHIIATMRSKTHYEIVSDASGKKMPIKMGLAPIQREGLDYEFTSVLELDKDSHLYSVSKDRTQLFEGKHELLTQETGNKLLDWLMCGKSDADVLEEEKELAKKELLSSQTLAALRECFVNARKKYPKFESDFIAIADVRKLELEATNQEMN